MSNFYITQCKLQRNNQTKIVWIPENYAVQNKILSIQDVEKIRNIIYINNEEIRRIDEWEHGWKVLEVYATKVYNDDSRMDKNYIFLTLCEWS